MASLGYNISYASGTPYVLTATPAFLNFGTTDPEFTITSPGTYLIWGRVKINYNAATFSTNRIVTLKLRRINNTALDLPNGITTFTTPVMTTSTSSAGPIMLPCVLYTTTNANDLIQIFGSINTIPSAGTITAAEAEITVLKLS